MKKIKISVFSLFATVVTFVPVVAIAAESRVDPAAASSGGGSLGDTIGVFSGLINGVIPVLLALAVLIFFWGLAMYLLQTGSEESKQKGIGIMVSGIIAIFVMVSLWGIIGILQNTFNVTSEQSDVNSFVPKPIKR